MDSILVKFNQQIDNSFIFKHFLHEVVNTTLPKLNLSSFWFILKLIWFILVHSDLSSKNDFCHKNIHHSNNKKLLQTEKRRYGWESLHTSLLLSVIDKKKEPCDLVSSIWNIPFNFNFNLFLAKRWVFWCLFIYFFGGAGGRGGLWNKSNGQKCVKS